jgi:iron complex transport system ATP-binding protein
MTLRAVAALSRVDVVVDGARLLDQVSLTLRERRHMAILGPNGAGKTTLLRVLATRLFPTTGAAQVLGAEFGRHDLRPIRPRIGFVSLATDPMERARVRVDRLVAVARLGSSWPVGDPLVGQPALRADVERALERVGIAELAERRVDTLSQGERQRVRIARALSFAPDLLLLDEPFAGMDLGGRERLLADLDRLLAAPDAPTAVLVTHHPEELPVGIRDATLLRDGRVVAMGAVEEVLTDAPMSLAFGLPVRVRRERGRFHAVAVGADDR